MNERDLITLVKAQDRAALDIYCGRVTDLAAFLLRKWHKKDVVDDAIQHAFMKLLERPQDIRACTLRELDGWILRVADNYIKDRRKVGDGKRATPFSEMARPDDDGVEDYPYEEGISDESPGPETLAIERQRRERLQSLIMSLEAQCRDILMLNCVEENDLSSVGRRLGLTLDQTKKRKRHCLDALLEAAQRKHLIDLFDER